MFRGFSALWPEDGEGKASVSAALTIPNIEDLLGHTSPAWVWDVARRRIAWGNAAAIAFWGEESLLDLIELEFDPDDPTLVKLDRLATEFDEGSSLTRKLAFDLSSGRSWTACQCFPCVLDDGRSGLLILIDKDIATDVVFSRFSEMVQEAPVAMILFGTDGALLHQNMEAERLFGSYVRAGGLSSLLASADDALPLIARTISAGTVSRALTITTRNGPRAHRVTLRRVHDLDTNSHALLALFRDIADRRAREQDADKERAQIQAMLDLVSDFQWRMDKDLRFTRITGGFANTTGVRADALIGKTWRAVVQQFDLGPGATLAEALASRTAWRDQELVWPRHGLDTHLEVLHLSLSALPLADALGNFSGWNGIATRALSSTPVSYAQTVNSPVEADGDPETLLASLTDGILMLNTDGVVMRASQHAEETLGVITGQRLGSAFADQDADLLREYLLSLTAARAEGGFSPRFDNGIEVKTKSTPPHYLLLVVQALGDDYAGAAFTAAVRDITTSKRTETDLREALSQAQTANTQKSDFLTSVAHELRTPLNAIIGFSEIMRDERFGTIGDERYLSYAADIHASGELLLSLINDLLDLSKVEAGKFEPRFEQVDVATIIKQCVGMVKPGAADEPISIRMQIEENLPGLVADKRSLVQILLNLLSNAVKFTRVGGQVIVSAEISRIGDLTLSVQDTGIGMSADDLEQALAPFGQARNAVVHGRKGTGLGLPLAKALTEANRGALNIISEPGEGTLVQLVFPSTQVLQD